MKVHDYIHQEVLTVLQEKIQEVQGAEIFALGTVQEKKVTAVEVLGRGNYQAAPVVNKGIKSGMVVIHNHPTGDLHPSAADIQVASALEHRGVGFFIINNTADAIYVVVEPFPEHILTEEELLPFFLPEGPLDSFFPRYEYRPQQLEMVQSILQSFNEKQHLLVEAATGTGKSWAYLLPALFWAEKDQGPVVISTNTINLQQQLLAKDLPALKKILPFSFQAVLMLGRGNYLCLRQMRYWQDYLEKEGDELEKMEIARIKAWSLETRQGVRTELNPQPEASVWERIASEGDTCLVESCPYHQKCYFQKNRREAAAADLIIINHHLFFSDLALRSSLQEERALIIPSHETVIFDEAHNLEEVALHHLGLRVCEPFLLRILDKLYGKKRNGLLFLLRGRLDTLFTDPEVKMILQKQFDALIPQVLSLKELSRSFFQPGEEFFRQGGRKSTEALRLGPWVLEEQRWETLLEKWEEFKEGLHLLLEGLQHIRSVLQKQDESRDGLEDMVEIVSIQRRILDFSSSLDVILSLEQEEMVFWLEMKGKDLYFMAAPLHIGERMKEALFNCKASVVLTSATLTVNKSFQYIRKTLGLSSSLEESQELCLDSPFHYPDQALVLIPEDLPLPAERNFVDEAISFMEPLLYHLEGRTLFLFTAYQMLNRFSISLQPLLRKKGIVTLSQGQMGRKEMVEIFQKRKKAVILGTASFWEGVDIPGEDLFCVVILKLPFPVPTDPVVEARSEHLKEQGQNPFTHYFLPKAVIRFRQGFGRLIRTQQDRGVVVILDQRISTRGYGQVFLSSLPPGVPVVKGHSPAVQEKFLQFTQ